MKKFFKQLKRTIVVTIILAPLAAGFVLFELNKNLPNAQELRDVQLQTPLKIFSEDKKLIAEFGEKRRSPIKITEVPLQLKQAILATEDSRFYQHNGVDLKGLMRAAVHLVSTGTKGQGGSTITMQVARNFFLTRKKTYLRKFNEILLAFKIEKEFTKDEILELYLNKIYFGKRAYGVEAAAEVYYGVSVKNLTLPQIAMVAGLPQAPSAINPLNNPEAAIKRRNHVLNRMFYFGYIGVDEYYQAINSELSAKHHNRQIEVKAPFVAEMVRQQLLNDYGEQIYTAGIEVYTTINSRLQQAANLALRNNLIAYDKRHGYRGPVDKINKEIINDPLALFNKLKQYPKSEDIVPAVVIAVSSDNIKIKLENSAEGIVDFEQIKWARSPIQDGQYLGNKLNSPSDAVQIGDVVYVKPSARGYAFMQLPEAEAAIVALSPKNGAIKALSGGFDYSLSNFNRAIQAQRQPGSNFKPFIYAAALEQGFTAASTINDAPVIFDDKTLENIWRPQNDSRQFYGPTRLRVGLIKSRNLVSIRLLQAIGIDNAINYITNFGFKKERLPHGLSLALGTNAVTPLELAQAYSIFANGGYKVQSFFIDKIQTRDGSLIYQSQPQIACSNYYCNLEGFNVAPLATSPQIAYLITSMLKDAIQNGTGRRAKTLKRDDLAGKTGTTNDKIDAWYSGYNNEIVATTWVGFDEPRSLHEYGSQVALPMWIDFMLEALQDQPSSNLPQPPGIVSVRIDPTTGLLSHSQQQDAIFEVFRSGNEPKMQAPRSYVASGGNVENSSDSSGGLF